MKKLGWVNKIAEKQFQAFVIRVRFCRYSQWSLSEDAFKDSSLFLKLNDVAGEKVK